MKREAIEELIKGNREIEFSYHTKRYSITYYNDNREKYISVCQFGEEPIDVSNAKEVLNLNINGITLDTILSSLPDNAFDIY